MERDGRPERILGIGQLFAPGTACDAELLQEAQAVNAHLIHGGYRHPRRCLSAPPRPAPGGRWQSDSANHPVSVLEHDLHRDIVITRTRKKKIDSAGES
jgi:hypothetical protein